MPDLTKAQLRTLRFAAERSDGGLLPLNRAANLQGSARAGALAELVARGLAVEQETANKKRAWRIDGKTRYTLVITPKGRQAVETLTPSPRDNDDLTMLDCRNVRYKRSNKRKPAPPPKANSKTEQLLSLLRRRKGAALAELQQTTGWQSHSVRAALSHLRRKGHHIERFESAGTNRYRLNKQAPS